MYFSTTFYSTSHHKGKDMHTITRHIHRAAAIMLAGLVISTLPCPALAQSQKMQGRSVNTKVSGRAKALDRAKETALSTISLAAAKAHIGFLASDELEGRKAGEKGSKVAVRYITSLLQQWGIQPLAGNDYLQPFEAYSEEWQKRKPFYVEADSVIRLKNQPHRVLHLQNVLGMIAGRNPAETVVIGAHFDHVGYDASLEGDQIYNGADDNASGVSAALQIAKAFAESGIQPERNVIFAFWDGEELGLLGSKYFVQTYDGLTKVKGYLNFDMIGRNNKPDNPQHVVYFFTESHPAFGKWLKADIEHYGLHLDPDYRAWDKPIGGSDNGSFAKHDIPVIWYHTDGHPDYHQPGDEADKINYDKVTDITKAAFLNAWSLANEPKY